MIKTKLTKQEKLIRETVPEFARLHPDLLIIVCDPKTDNIFVGHRNQMVSGKIKSADGKKLDVVKGVIDHSQFEGSINHFITGLMEALQLPLKAGNMFYQFIDGALFNISKNLRKHKVEKGAIPSPYAKVDTLKDNNQK